MTASMLNIFGLCLDIAGVIGLFCFGLPKKTGKEGFGLQVQPPKPGYEARKKLYNRLAWASLALLVAGFVLQILANLTLAEG